MEAELTEEMVEKYIDKHGMIHLLTMLENICHEKAEHVTMNYNDRNTASAWRRGANRIYKCAKFEDWPL